MVNTTIQNSKWSKSLNYNQSGSTNGATERLVATLAGFLTSQPLAAARLVISFDLIIRFGFTIPRGFHHCPTGYRLGVGLSEERDASHSPGFFQG